MKLNYRSFIQVVLLGSSSYEAFMKMKQDIEEKLLKRYLILRVFESLWT